MNKNIEFGNSRESDFHFILFFIFLSRLDLSFNEIEKIEGLSTLMDLEDLSLYVSAIFCSVLKSLPFSRF